MKTRTILTFPAVLVSAVGLAAISFPASGATIFDVDFEVWNPNIGNADGADDGDRVQDVSGNGYHGFWGGGNPAANDTPIIATPGGTGVDTRSTDGYVIVRDGLTGIPAGWDGPTTSISPYFNINATDSYTFEAVLNWQGNSNTAAEGIMGYTGTVEWWIRENGGRIEYVFDDGPNRVQQTTINPINVSVSNSDWHHVAVVLDRTNDEIRTYFDYGLVYTDPSAAIASLGAIGDGTQDVRLGGYNTAAANRFDGFQDRYRISTGALSTSEFIPIPEPSTAILFGVAGIGLIVRRRR